MLAATGKINNFEVQFHVLPRGIRYIDYCRENEIKTTGPNVFIDVIGGDDYEDLADWTSQNPSASEILKTAGVDLSDARTIIQIQKEVTK